MKKIFALTALCLLFLAQVFAAQIPYKDLNPFTLPPYFGSLDDPSIKTVVEIDGYVYVYIDGVWDVYAVK